MTERASLSLPHSEKGFHGISALAFSGASDQVLAFSDRGWVREYAVGHDDDGTLLSLAVTAEQPVETRRGDGPSANDIEAAAVLRDGRWLIGLERPHRLALFPGGGIEAFADKPDFWAEPKGMGQLPANSGAEAMTPLPDGQVMIISEHKRAGVNTVWLGASGDWSAARYRTDSGFSPVDLARHPCGGVLVLERAASLLRGLTARLAFLDENQIDRLADGEPVAPQIIGPIEPEAGLANFEAMAVYPTSGADDVCPEEIQLLVMSDDNGNRLLPRIAAQYRLSR